MEELRVKLSVVDTDLLQDLFKYYCDKSTKAYNYYKSVKDWGNQGVINEAYTEYHLYAKKCNYVATELNQRGLISYYTEV